MERGPFGEAGPGSLARTLLEGAEAWARASAPELLQAARAIRADEQGHTSGEYRLVADMMEIDARTLGGDWTSANQLARAAAQRAAKEGRVWHRLALLNRAEDEQSEADVARLVDRLASGRRREQDRRRLHEAWRQIS